MLTCRLTDDVELRALEPWLAAEFARFVDAHRAFLARWVPIPAIVADEASAHRFLTGYAERTARDEGRIYGIWRAGELVGGTVFRRFDATARTCELGVWLAPTATGRGIVTMACAAMLEWAFGVRGIRRAEWLVEPGNAPSIAVARRLGMQRDGLLRAAVARADRQGDLEVWSVLAEEWAQRHPR